MGTAIPVIETREALFALTPEEFTPGSVVILAYPSECSACIGQGDHTLWDGVMVKNITAYEGGWHGYWWCEQHWARYVAYRGGRA
jgi:hypothetical protein